MKNKIETERTITNVLAINSTISMITLNVNSPNILIVPLGQKDKTQLYVICEYKDTCKIIVKGWRKIY